MKHIRHFLTYNSKLNKNVFFRSTQLILLALLIFQAPDLLAEGSKELTAYPGYRMFLDSRDPQQLKAFAKAGEYINVGASHVGIAGGFIRVYRPNGTLALTINSAASGLGVINNNIEEANGPTGGGATNGPGYKPAIVKVLEGEEGVWTVHIGFPTYSTANFTNLLNSSPWTRATHQPVVPSVILAWDVTVTQNAAGNDGGTAKKGRVYSNELATVINQNGFTTSPVLYVLTIGGFLYSVNFKEVDPFRFPISSGSKGLITSDFKATYKSYLRESVNRSANPANWVPGQIYHYEPQAEDLPAQGLINNKIFFNLPDQTMPPTATVTDIFRNKTHSTWLFNIPFPFKPDLHVISIHGENDNGTPCTSNSIQVGIGAYIRFSSSQGGVAVLSLDLNNNGSFNDPVDRQLRKAVGVGQDTIFWNGRDGLGNAIPASMNFIFPYKLELTDGETHILLSDIENNLGGVTFNLLSNVMATATNEFYYDHSLVSGPVSGGGTPNHALPTTQPFTYGDNFGNNIILSNWIYAIYLGADTGVFDINLVDNCTPTFVLDTDGDGIPDTIDLDNDNDGIPDKKEFCNPTGGYACLPGGHAPSADADGDGVPNYMDANDQAIPNGCTDDDNDGICDVINPIYDTDGDGIPDHLDLDSDNDGITDLVEAGHNQPDVNGDGVIDGPPSAFGQNGLYNPIASDPDALDAVETYNRSDCDNDGIPDHDDLDSDNDGIHDVAEAGFGNSDSNNDGRTDIANNTPLTAGTKGLASIIDPGITNMPIPLPPDCDGDGIPNWRDLDSDNDLIHDVAEGGNLDADNNGIIGTGTPIVDENGKATGHADTYFISTTSRPADTDEDMIPDYIDLDTDNDGINDVVEAGGSDPDNNALPGLGIPTVNAKGVPIGNNFQPTSSPRNSDNDEIADYRDLDSDNDGINDVAEASMPDPDNDGFIGSGAPVVNAKGQAIATQDGTQLSTTSILPDTDGDGTPDYLDLDSDGDGIRDVIEAGQPDPDFDGIIGEGTPDVNDHGQAFFDPNNGPLATTSSPTNTDGDELPDFRDLDSDNDNISDENECPSDSPCIDGDGDGAPDFQDFDRDNDGINDAYECDSGFPCVDTDGDGIPDVDDLDTDGDGLPDADECPGGAPCPSSVPNDIPDWRKYNCHPGTVVPVITGISEDASVCEGSSVTLTANSEIPLTGHVTYTWTGPNNFIFTGSAPSQGPFPVALSNLNSGSSGDYNLQVLTQFGCPSQPATVNVAVSQSLPVPHVTANISTPCQGSSLELSTDAIVGNNVQYHWFFDNGSGPVLLATTAEPGYVINTVTAFNSGNYTVQISAEGDCSSPPSLAQNIQVTTEQNQAPFIEVSGNVICEGEDLELISNDYPGATVTYEWFLNNGGNVSSLGTTNVPQLTINNTVSTNSGFYSVKAVVNGCDTPESNTEQVIVGDKIGPPALSLNGTMLCAGDSLVLNATSYPGIMVNYHWIFNGPAGSATLATTTVPSLTIQSIDAFYTGIYVVVASSAGCNSLASTAESLTVTNVETLRPFIEVSDNAICEGETLGLSSREYPGATVSYNWYLNNGGIVSSLGTTDVPSLILPNIVSTNTGFYSVVAEVNGCATASSLTEQVIVGDAISPPDLNLSADVLCEGGSLVLSATNYPGVLVEYLWLFNGPSGTASFGTTTSPSLTLENISVSTHSGSYVVVASSIGCQPQISNVGFLTVNQAISQVPELEVSQNLICENGDLQLNTDVYPGDEVQYQWFFDNGTGAVLLASTDIPAFSISQSAEENTGFYSVQVFADACTSPASDAQEVVINTISNETPELSLNANELCPGENIVLTSNPFSGQEVQYAWYYSRGGDPQLLGTSNTPSFTIENVTVENSGMYQVQVTDGDCTSLPSAFNEVSVMNSLDQAPSLNIVDNVLCTGETLELETSAFPGSNVKYRWFFDTGNDPVLLQETTVPTLIINNVSPADAGNYTLVVTAGNCISPASAARKVEVTNTAGTAPALSASTTRLCQGETLTLNSAAVPGGNSTYEWFFDNGTGTVSLGTTNVPTFFVPNMNPTQNGIYSVVGRTGSCATPVSNQINIQVVNAGSLTLTNSTSASTPACSNELIQLSVPFMPGAAYQWSGPLGFTSTAHNPVILNATPAHAGDYTVTVLMNGCTFTAAPTTVYVYSGLQAKDDYYEVKFNQMLEGADVTLNDLPGNLTDFDLTILEQALRGEASKNGKLFNYRPERNFFGKDQFVYAICNPNCPEDCASATVTIKVAGIDQAESCFVPNVITPNGDGLNDFFTVPCLADTYTNNSVKIFNRWGDQVFQAKQYRNDWDGKYKGNALPPGTYFYIIQLEANKPESEFLQGYFTIIR